MPFAAINIKTDGAISWVCFDTFISPVVHPKFDMEHLRFTFVLRFREGSLTMMKSYIYSAGLALISVFMTLSSCSGLQSASGDAGALLGSDAPAERALAPGTPDTVKKILASATEQTKVTKAYDPAYIVLDYPNGDVPMETGVCTDVVIRALRKAGVDLQKQVHEDMRGNFSLYPTKWGLTKADPNIDHRRVPNLRTFFTRKGKSLDVTERADDYKPGDIVSWDLDGKGLTHIGLVSNLWSKQNKRYLIIHNIGSGAKAEDVLFDWKITGHFRYF